MVHEEGSLRDYRHTIQESSSLVEVRWICLRTSSSEEYSGQVPRSFSPLSRKSSPSSFSGKVFGENGETEDFTPFSMIRDFHR